MKKKFLSIIMAAAVLAGLTACGGSAVSSDNANGTQKENETSGAAEQQSKDIPVSVEEQVLVDWEGFKITVTGMEGSISSGYPSLTLDLENGYSKPVNVEVSKIFINGCCVETDGINLGNIQTGIPAGKSEEDKLSLETHVEGFLKNIGISEIGSIQCEFVLRDASMDYYDDAGILYTSDPIEIKTSAYDSIDQTAMEEGSVLYDKDGIRIIAKTVAPYAQMANYGIYLYGENTTDKNIAILSHDTAVNGSDVTGSLVAWYIPANSSSADTLVMEYDSNIPDADAISNITEVSFGLEIYDEDNWTFGDTDAGLLTDTGILNYKL